MSLYHSGLIFQPLCAIIRFWLWRKHESLLSGTPHPARRRHRHIRAAKHADDHRIFFRLVLGMASGGSVLAFLRWTLQRAKKS
jgi:hypothetical protein